jgi:hypothetical protein
VGVDAAPPLTGAFKWAVPLSGLSRVSQTVVRDDGHVIAIGTMSADLTFAGGTVLTLKGRADLLALELDASGKLVWAEN